MPENDRSGERTGHDDPHRDFEEDPLVELARIVSEGSNTRLSVEPRTVQPLDDDDYGREPYSPAEPDASDYQDFDAEQQGDDGYEPDEQDEAQSPVAEAPYRHDDALEAELDAAFESRFPAERNELKPLHPLNPYHAFNAFGRTQPEPAYEDDVASVEMADAGYESDYDDLRSDEATGASSPAHSSAVEPDFAEPAPVELDPIEPQPDASSLDDDLLADFEDELRSAFDKRVGAQQQPAEPAPNRDEFDDLFDEVTQSAPQVKSSMPASKTDSDIVPDTSGASWPAGEVSDRVSDSVRVSGEFAAESPVKPTFANLGHSQRPASFAPPTTFAASASGLDRISDDAEDTSDLEPKAHEPVQMNRPEPDYPVAPKHDAEAIADEAHQRAGGGYDDDYDDLYEETPPAEGYDLDAVARAMKESDPALSGHGVLPPHSAAEEMATPEGRSRRGLVVAAAVAGLAIIGGTAFALIDFGGGDADIGPPPVIVAQEGELKIYPEESREQPRQGKLIYDRVGGTQGTQEERLILPEETPVASLPPAPVTEPESSPSASPLPAGPRRVRTVIVRPDGTIISGGAEEETAVAPVASLPEPETPAAPRQISTDAPVAAVETPPVSENVATDPAEINTAAAVVEEQPPETPAAESQPQAVEAQPEEPAAAPSVEFNAALPRAKPTDRPIAVAAAPATPRQDTAAESGPVDLTGNAAANTPAPAPVQTPPQVPATEAAPAPVTTASIPAGTYVVQVSSQRSEEQAQVAFTDLKRRYSSVLGSVTPVIEKADLGDRGTFYRVRIPSNSRDEAIRLCEALKAAGGDCFVRQN